MQKKIFLQKNNPRGGSRPLLKWLMWGALALVILVAVTPLINRQKNHKEASKKPGTEKGIVVKEVPKLPAGSSTTTQIPEGTGARAIRGAVPGIESTPVQKESSTPAEEGMALSARDRTMETGGENPPSGQGWVEVKPPEAGGKTPPVATEPASGAKPSLHADVGASPAAKQAVPPVKPGAPTASKETKRQQAASLGASSAKASENVNLRGGNATAAKQPIGSGKIAYSVQVGSFKDKKNAELMQANLQKRGYAVSLQERVHPKLGQIYVVQLQAVDDISKASTQVEQIKHVEKVKPVIIKVPKE